MTDVAKHLLDEIVRRDKELNKLKEAYEVISGTKILGIETIQVKVPTKTEAPVRGKPKSGKMSEEDRKKISEGMKKAWAKRKKKAKPVGEGSFKGLSKKEKGKIISERMKNYWAKRREEKLAKRGLPTVIETHHQPVAESPILDKDPFGEKEQKAREKGRLAFLPVGRVRKNRAWTDEEDAFLKDMWGKRTTGELAGMLLRTVRNIEKRYVKLKEDEVIKKTLRMPKSEKGAKFMDSYRKSWDAGLTNTKKKWSPEEDDRLMWLADEGLTSKQVSKELKRSVGSVLLRYNRLSGGQSVFPAERKRKSRKSGNRKSSVSILDRWRGG